jgi:hypothetical protein
MRRERDCSLKQELAALNKSKTHLFKRESVSEWGLGVGVAMLRKKHDTFPNHRILTHRF